MVFESGWPGQLSAAALLFGNGNLSQIMFHNRSVHSSGAGMEGLGAGVALSAPTHHSALEIDTLKDKEPIFECSLW